jgi:ABC-2 type transport system permease protein
MNTVRSEWIKLRTVTVHWVLAIIGLVFPIVVTALVSTFGEVEFDLQSDELSSLIAGLTIVSAMLFGALAAISVTAEFAHNTIRPTYAATPKRVRVVIAKLAVNTAFVGFLTAFVVAASWGAASLILAARDGSVSLSDNGVLPSLIAVCVHSVIVSWFAFGLGMIIRNSPATVTIFLLWPLLLENLIGVVLTLIGWDGATKWLPYGAGITATVAEDESDVLGRPNGLIYFAVVSLAIVAVGAWSNERRDA